MVRLLLCLLVMCSLAIADTKVKQYRIDMAVPDGPMAHFTQVYIQGLGEGFMWANANAKANGKPQMFCAPEQLVLTIENYIDIINQHIQLWEKSPERSSKMNVGGCVNRHAAT